MFPCLFRNVDSAVAILEKNVNFDEVKELLRVYEMQKHLNKGPYKKENLLIVLEGLDGSGKSTLAKKLTTKLHGTQRMSPPSCLSGLRTFFDGQDTQLRRAFYALGNYISSYEIMNDLQKKHVVLDRFWHSTASYAIAECAHEPEKTFDWPEDLLKPDVVFFLVVSEHTRAKRMSRRVLTDEEGRLQNDSEFRKRLYNAFMSMRNPGVVEINSNVPLNQVTFQVMDILRTKYNITFPNKPT